MMRAALTVVVAGVLWVGGAVLCRASLSAGVDGWAAGGVVVVASLCYWAALTGVLCVLADVGSWVGRSISRRW